MRYMCHYLYLILFLFSFQYVYAHTAWRNREVILPPDAGAGQATVDGTDLTTTQASDIQLEQTTLPESDVEEAMKLEVGTYSPMVREFQYFNDQNSNRFNPNNQTYYDRCYFDYVRCTVSQSNPTPVCSTYDHEVTFHNLGSYCDVYFDNCRKRHRHWRIVDSGKCKKMGGGYYNYKVFKTRRFKLPKIHDIFNFLGTFFK